MCGGPDRLKGISTTQKQDVAYRSKKKGVAMVFKSNGLRREPNGKQTVR